MTPDQQSPRWGETAREVARRRAALAAKFGGAWLAEMDQIGAGSDGRIRSLYHAFRAHLRALVRRQ